MEHQKEKPKENFMESFVDFLRRLLDAGIRIDIADQYFGIHIIKDGKPVEHRIPNWKKIPYYDSEGNETKVGIKEDILNTLREDENPLTKQALEKLNE